MADNTKQKYRTMQILSLLRFALYGLAAIIFFKDITLGFYVTLGINFISDCFGKGYTPLANAIFMSYTKEEDIAPRQATLSAVSSLVSAVGPLIGSALLMIMTESWIVLVNAGSFLVTALIFAQGKNGFITSEKEIQMPEATQGNILATMKEGLNVLKSNQVLLTIISFALVVNMLFSPFQKIIIPLSINGGACQLLAHSQ